MVLYGWWWCVCLCVCLCLSPHHNIFFSHFLRSLILILNIWSHLSTLFSFNKNAYLHHVYHNIFNLIFTKKYTNIKYSKHNHFAQWFIWTNIRDRKKFIQRISDTYRFSKCLMFFLPFCLRTDDSCHCARSRDCDARVNRQTSEPMRYS